MVKKPTTNRKTTILSLDWKVRSFTFLRLKTTTDMDVDLCLLNLELYFNVRNAVRIKGMLKRLL